MSILTDHHATTCPTRELSAITSPPWRTASRCGSHLSTWMHSQLAGAEGAEAPLPLMSAQERRAWSKAEDALIVKLVAEHGTKRWSLISEQLNGRRLGPARTGKQCRTR